MTWAEGKDAMAFMGFLGEPLGRIFGTTNSLGVAARFGGGAPASIQALIVVISSGVSFFRLPGGIINFFPSFSKRPSIIFTKRLSLLLPGSTAGPISPPFIRASKLSIT